MESTSMPVNNHNNKSRKQLFLLSVVVILLLVGVILIVTSGGSKKKTTQQAMATDPGYNQTNAQLRDYKYQAEVLITANGPLPATLNVGKDTKISWRNTDNKAHEIAIVSTEKVPPYFFNKRTIEAQGGYPWVVHQPVTFHYYVVDSPTQTGVIVVK
jgi:plastocyanin